MYRVWIVIVAAVFIACGNSKPTGPQEVRYSLTLENALKGLPGNFKVGMQLEDPATKPIGGVPPLDTDSKSDSPRISVTVSKDVTLNGQKVRFTISYIELKVDMENRIAVGSAFINEENGTTLYVRAWYYQGNGGPGAPSNEISFPFQKDKVHVVTLDFSYIGSEFLFRARLPQPAPADTVFIGVDPVKPVVSVEAGELPVSTLAPQRAARLAFARFRINTNAAVTGIEIERAGLGSDIPFEEILLLDEGGMRWGSGGKLGENHRATIYGVLPTGSSKEFTVAATMRADLSAHAGETPSLDVVGVLTGTPADIRGLPIYGASHTINATIEIGSLSLAAVLILSENVTLHSVGVAVAGIRLTAGSSEPIKLSTIRWKQYGDVGIGDLANLYTYAEGRGYSMKVEVDGLTNEICYSAQLDGYVLSPGASLDLYLKGDVVGGVGRSIIFVLNKRDVYANGSNYGYGIIPSGEDYMGPRLIITE